MCKVAQRTLPPDGGYGWIVVFACALKKFFSIPIVVQFGLVLKEGYDETNITQAQGNLVLILRQALEFIFSIFGGSLLQRFGYRKAAVIGGVLGFLGLFLTSVATTFWQLILYFGIILSIGEAVAVPAFTFGLNSYFEEKRSKASGLVLFGAGLGPIILPKVMGYLLHTFGWRYTVLTLSGLFLHCILAALLLRPIKYYTKVQLEIEETAQLYNNVNTVLSTTSSGKPTLIQSKALGAVNGLTRCTSEQPLKCDTNTTLNNVASCPNIANEPQDLTILLPIEDTPIVGINKLNGVVNENGKIKIENQINTPKNDKKITRMIIDFFGLTLMKDPVFVNILSGLTLALCAEDIFRLLLPIVLEDMLQLERSEITTIQSTTAFADLLFRLLGPYITHPWRKTPRLIYVTTLSVNIITYIVMMNISSYNGMLYVATAMGVAKGIRAVYMTVIIPDYVPIHRLPFALAIFRFFRGITVLSIGLIFLQIRESTGSFKNSIVIINIFTIITIFLWTAEYLYFKTKKTVAKNEIPNDDS